MQFKQTTLTTTNQFKLLSLYPHTSDHELQLATLFNSPHKLEQVPKRNILAEHCSCHQSNGVMFNIQRCMHTGNRMEMQAFSQLSISPMKHEDMLLTLHDRCCIGPIACTTVLHIPFCCNNSNNKLRNRREDKNE